MLGGRIFGMKAVRNLVHQLVSMGRTTLVEGAENRLRLLVGGYSQNIWSGRERTEIALLFQAREVEAALAGTGDPSRPVLYTGDFASDGNPPPDILPSSLHSRAGDKGQLQFLDVSYSAQVFHLPPEVKKQDVC